MTLLITVFAAAASTIAWYKKPADDTMQLGTLCLMYWGAALMWLADVVSEYIEFGADCFRPPAFDMLNDTYLGLSAVALGLVIWIAVLLIKDPTGRVRAALKNDRK